MKTLRAMLIALSLLMLAGVGTHAQEECSDSPLSIPEQRLRGLGMACRKGAGPSDSEVFALLDRYGGELLFSNQWAASGRGQPEGVEDVRYGFPSERDAEDFYEGYRALAAQGLGDGLELSEETGLGDEAVSFEIAFVDSGVYVEDYYFLFRAGASVGEVSVQGGKPLARGRALELAHLAAERSGRSPGGATADTKTLRLTLYGDVPKGDAFLAAYDILGGGTGIIYNEVFCGLDKQPCEGNGAVYEIEVDLRSGVGLEFVYYRLPAGAAPVTDRTNARLTEGEPFYSANGTLAGTNAGAYVYGDSARQEDLPELPETGGGGLAGRWHATQP